MTTEYLKPLKPIAKGSQHQCQISNEYDCLKAVIGTEREDCENGNLSSDYFLHSVMKDNMEVDSTRLYDELQAGVFSRLDQPLSTVCLYQRRKRKMYRRCVRQKMPHQRKRSNQWEPSKIIWY